MKLTKTLRVLFFAVAGVAMTTGVCSAAEKAVGARDKSGAPQGAYKIVNDAGDTEAAGNFVAGKMDGLWMFFNSRHVKIAEVTYREGERTGVFHTYFGSTKYPQAAGKLESEGRLLRGVITGRHVAYDPEGKVFDDVVFNADGTVITVTKGDKETAQKVVAADIQFIDTIEAIVKSTVK